jgi:hypothetical protein
MNLMISKQKYETEKAPLIEAQGYQIVDDHTGSSQQRFRHLSGSFQLFIFERGTVR